MAEIFENGIETVPSEIQEGLEREVDDLEDAQLCEDCWKDKRICVCDGESPVDIKTELLILQHPREAANAAGTARLASLNVNPSTHRIGLSWRSLSHALGRNAEPKKWAVLFLGTQKGSKVKKGDLPFGILGNKGQITIPKNLEGLILLDGNWKQSKTLWWRNPWLLKLHRAVLRPTERSIYHKYRRQPRRDCLSTIEAAAGCLDALGNEQAAIRLRTTLVKFLERWETVNASPSSEISEPEAKPDSPPLLS